MEKKAHLVWCAMIALLTARQNGLVTSEVQENLFITRWFAQAKKERRFSKDVAIDIDWMLNQGKIHGTRSQLYDKLHYIWRICTGELSEQNDLFRLSCALEMIKQSEWRYQILRDNEWSIRNFVSNNSIYLQQTSLEIAFNEEGIQILLLPARIIGNVIELRLLLKKYGWDIIDKNGDSKLMANDFIES